MREWGEYNHAEVYGFGSVRGSVKVTSPSGNSVTGAPFLFRNLYRDDNNETNDLSSPGKRRQRALRDDRRQGAVPGKGRRNP